MPIFTTQLGKVEHLSPQEAVKQMADYIRSLQDTLEYRLYTLDSSNIAEVDASVTTITIAGEDATKVIEDMNNEVSKLEKTVDGYKTEVGKYSNAVEGYEQELAELSEEILGYGDDVKEYDAQVASFQQTVNGFNATVIGYEKTAAGYEAEYSQFNQTAEAIEAEVAEVNGKYTEMKLTVDGLTVTDEDGATKIKGGSIETDTLFVKAANIRGEVVAQKLNGNIINLINSDGEVFGQMQAGTLSMYIISGVGSGFLMGGTNANPVVQCLGKFYAENYEERLLELEDQVAALMRMFG